MNFTHKGPSWLKPWTFRLWGKSTYCCPTIVWECIPLLLCLCPIMKWNNGHHKNTKPVKICQRNRLLLTTVLSNKCSYLSSKNVLELMSVTKPLLNVEHFIFRFETSPRCAARRKNKAHCYFWIQGNQRWAFFKLNVIITFCFQLS